MSLKKMAALVVAAGLLLAAPVWAEPYEEPTLNEASAEVVEVVEVAAAEKGLAKKAENTVEKPLGPELSEAQKQVLEKFYLIMPELKELKVETAYSRDESSWAVALSNRSGTEAEPSAARSVQAHLFFAANTGELISFDIQHPEWAAEEYPSVDLAKEKAVEFAQQIFGDKLSDYQMREAIGFFGGSSLDSQGNRVTWVASSIQFYRLINGIPLLNSGFQVNVDAAGRIIGFHNEGEDQYDSAVFPAPAQAISQAAAEAAFAEQINLKLMYNGHQPIRDSMFGSQVETRPVLMYTPSYPAPIDATTGAVMTGEGMTVFDQRSMQSQRVVLFGEGQKLFARTPEEGARLLAEEFGVSMAGMKFGHVHTQEEPLTSANKVTYYSWHSEPRLGDDGQPDYQDMRNVALRTVADTGQVLSFDVHDGSGRGKSGVVAAETAQNTAVQFLQRYLDPGRTELELQTVISEDPFPAWVDKSKLKNWEMQPPEIYFYFNKVYQGVPVADQSYSVRVDARTGNIIGFTNSCRDSSVELPDNKDVAAPEAVKAEFLKQHSLYLAYIWPEYLDQKAPAPSLVYLPTFAADYGYIDAFTGKTVAVKRGS